MCCSSIKIDISPLLSAVRKIKYPFEYKDPFLDVSPGKDWGCHNRQPFTKRFAAAVFTALTSRDEKEPLWQNKVCPWPLGAVRSAVAITVTHTCHAQNSTKRAMNNDVTDFVHVNHFKTHTFICSKECGTQIKLNSRDLFCSKWAFCVRLPCNLNQTSRFWCKGCTDFRSLFRSRFPVSSDCKWGKKSGLTQKV